MSQALTVDDRSRVTIPEVKPGEVYEVEHPEPGLFVLRRVDSPKKELPRPRLERKNGRLMFVGGRSITSDEVKKMLEDFP